MKLNLDKRSTIEIKNNTTIILETSDMKRIKGWISFIDKYPEAGTYTNKNNLFRFEIKAQYVDFLHSQINKYKIVKTNRTEWGNKDYQNYEHILVAEKILNRKLKKEEVVHHIDGDRSNNNPQNLMIFATNKDHLGYHAGRKAYLENDVWKTERKVITKICPQCGKTFNIRPNEYYDQRLYCSLKCSNNAKKVIKLSGKEIQELLYSNGGNMAELARSLGVTATSVSRILKKDGLPYNAKDYKNK